MLNHKIVRPIGETVKRPVGADDSVRPLGNCKFAATRRKNGRASCGSMWASTPTNGVRVRIGASVFAGTHRRADRAVRPYNSADAPLDKFARVRIIKVGHHSERL